MPEATIGVTLDCNDLMMVSRFWRDALGYVESAPPDPAAIFHGLMSPSDRGGLHHLTLQRVPEAKAGKNRAHLDLFVEDLDAEVLRLEALGGEVVSPAASEGGFRTAVMGDPEGNEFCVVQRS